MEHYEAIEMMASERYLLDELTPEVRDAYEDHLFGCEECANDVRFGEAFLQHAKKVLPGMMPAPPPARPEVRADPEKRDWFAWPSFSWLRPAIMVPAFACLLALVGYQNLVVYPALQASAAEPRLLPPATVLEGATRGGVPIVYADPAFGSALTVPLPASMSYSAYKFDLYASDNKLIWTRTLRNSEVNDDMASIWLPSHVRRDVYKLAVTGVTAGGENISLQPEFFELRIKK